MFLIKISLSSLPLDILASPPFVGEDISDGAVVQTRGRFKVTSADLNPKVFSDK